MNIPNPFLIMAHFDLIGLSSEAKPTTVKDGSTYFEVDTSNLYIFYKGTWYLQGEQEVSSVQNASLNNIISTPKELGKIEPAQEIIEPVEETEEIEEPEEVQEIEELKEGEE